MLKLSANRLEKICKHAFILSKLMLTQQHLVSPSRPERNTCIHEDKFKEKKKQMNINDKKRKNGHDQNLMRIHYNAVDNDIWLFL